MVRDPLPGCYGRGIGPLADFGEGLPFHAVLSGSKAKYLAVLSLKRKRRGRNALKLAFTVSGKLCSQDGLLLIRRNSINRCPRYGQCLYVFLIVVECG